MKTRFKIELNGKSRRLTALLALTLRPRIFAKRPEQGSVLLPSSGATALVALDVTLIMI